MDDHIDNVQSAGKINKEEFANGLVIGKSYELLDLAVFGDAEHSIIIFKGIKEDCVAGHMGILTKQDEFNNQLCSWSIFLMYDEHDIFICLSVMVDIKYVVHLKSTKLLHGLL